MYTCYTSCIARQEIGIEKLAVDSDVIIKKIELIKTRFPVTETSNFSDLFFLHLFFLHSLALIDFDLYRRVLIRTRTFHGRAKTQTVA